MTEKLLTWMPQTNKASFQSNECLFFREATEEHSSPEGDHLVSTGLYTSVVPQTASQRYVWLYRQVSYACRYSGYFMINEICAYYENVNVGTH